MSKANEVAEEVYSMLQQTNVKLILLGKNLKIILLRRTGWLKIIFCILTFQCSLICV